MRLLKSLSLLLSAWLVLAPLAQGQTSTGEVNGTITDPNGAIVNVATVKLINQATRIEAQATPKQNGFFTFINVVPGKYVLKVEAQGFKTAQSSPFDVGVSQVATQNVTLEVGEVSQVIEVVAGAEQ